MEIKQSILTYSTEHRVRKTESVLTVKVWSCSCWRCYRVAFGSWNEHGDSRIVFASQKGLFTRRAITCCWICCRIHTCRSRARTWVLNNHNFIQIWKTKLIFTTADERLTKRATNIVYWNILMRCLRLGSLTSFYILQHSYFFQNIHFPPAPQYLGVNL